MQVLCGNRGCVTSVHRLKPPKRYLNWQLAMFAVLMKYRTIALRPPCLAEDVPLVQEVRDLLLVGLSIPKDQWPTTP